MHISARVYKEYQSQMDNQLDNILETTIDFIRDNMEPEDIFDEDKLIEWAEDNGFIKE
jgi:hypothetical protein